MNQQEMMRQIKMILWFYFMISCVLVEGFNLAHRATPPTSSSPTASSSSSALYYNTRSSLTMVAINLIQPIYQSRLSISSIYLLDLSHISALATSKPFIYLRIYLFSFSSVPTICFLITGRSDLASEAVCAG